MQELLLDFSSKQLSVLCSFFRAFMGQSAQPVLAWAQFNWLLGDNSSLKATREPGRLTVSYQLGSHIVLSLKILAYLQVR